MSVPACLANVNVRVGLPCMRPCTYPKRFFSDEITCSTLAPTRKLMTIAVAFAPIDVVFVLIAIQSLLRCFGHPDAH